MDSFEASPCAALAAELRAGRTELATRWLDRIAARASIDPNLVFPTDELLDHMPLVIGGIADFLEDPGEVLSGQSGTIAWAMELGALRYKQGFSQLELHKEYQLLGSILFAFLVRAARQSNPPNDLGPVLKCAHWLFQAIAVVQQATTAQFLQQMTSALAERENRLLAFHRALTHDNGRGVPDAQRSRLFERFYRAHEAALPAIEGTGLGLSVVRETVGALGGQAWAEFPDGGGAIFAFSLPSRRAADLAMSEQPADANET